jgi:hypothetical protein
MDVDFLLVARPTGRRSRRSVAQLPLFNFVSAAAILWRGSDPTQP